MGCDDFTCCHYDQRADFNCSAGCKNMDDCIQTAQIHKAPDKIKRIDTFKEQPRKVDSGMTDKEKTERIKMIDARLVMLRDLLESSSAMDVEKDNMKSDIECVRHHVSLLTPDQPEQQKPDKIEPFTERFIMNIKTPSVVTRKINEIIDYINTDN